MEVSEAELQVSLLDPGSILPFTTLYVWVIR
jgi:hypothetical protein